MGNRRKPRKSPQSEAKRPKKQGKAGRAALSVTLDKLATFGIKSYEEYGGRIVFGANETETIYAVEASMPEEKIQQISEVGFPGWESSDEVFPFIDGSATLFSQTQSSSKPIMALILEPPEDGRFTYDLEITYVMEEGTSKWNQFELKNFSAEPIIRLSSTCDIKYERYNENNSGRTVSNHRLSLHHVFCCPKRP